MGFKVYMYVSLVNGMPTNTWECQPTSFSAFLKDMPASIFHCVIYMQFLFNKGNVMAC